MKELNRYDFTNDRSFITYLLSEADTKRMRTPECDVIGLRRRVIDPTENEQSEGPMHVMRPDEALVLARLLIDAVWQVTEGYSIADSDDLPRPLPLKDRPTTPKLVREPDEFDIELRRDFGIPLAIDRSIPKDEIHVRNNGKTEAVFRLSSE